MAIEAFLDDPARAREFARFAGDHYRDDNGWVLPRPEEVLARLSPRFYSDHGPGSDARHFLARAGGRVVGRISAMVHPSLVDGDGSPVGTVGHFESIDDRAVAGDLLGAATSWLRDARSIRRVWGPLNFDIWHGYRLMTGGFGERPFPGEPYNKPAYPEYFEESRFRPLQHWDSVEIRGREALEALALSGAGRYRLVRRRGYRFVPFDRQRFSDELGKLHALVLASFRRFPGFTPISSRRFERLLAPRREAFDPRFFSFVHDADDRPVAFSGAFPDLTAALAACRGRRGPLTRARWFLARRRVDRVLFYLGGVIPRERGKGIGRGGLHHAIRRFVEAGHDRVLFALMARGNSVRRLLGELAPTPMRQYTLYQWNA